MATKQEERKPDVKKFVTAEINGQRYYFASRYKWQDCITVLNQGAQYGNSTRITVNGREKSRGDAVANPTDEQIAAIYDKRGGAIYNKNGEKIANGEFWDFEKNSPKELKASKKETVESGSEDNGESKKTETSKNKK